MLLGGVELGVFDGVVDVLVLVGVGVGVGVSVGVELGVVDGVVVGVDGVFDGVVLGVDGVDDGVFVVRRVAFVEPSDRVGSVVGVRVGVPLVLGCGPTSTVGGFLSPVLCRTMPAATAPPRASTATAAISNGFRGSRVGAAVGRATGDWPSGWVP